MRISPQGIFLSIAFALSINGCSGSGGGGTLEGGAPRENANHPPTIAGEPDRSVRLSERYDFQPSARDQDGDSLVFMISGKPTWARFDPATGRLHGTPEPSDVGHYPEIQIRVSDGQLTSALPSFGIDVGEVGEGSVTLSWYPPTENEDGSLLSDLAGYRIYYGKKKKHLDRMIEIDNPGLTRYVVDNLSPTHWHFAMTAFTRDGIESRRSKIVSKKVA